MFVRMTDLHYASLLDLAEQLRTGALSPVTLTEAMLERIERVDPRLGAYATPTPDLAREQAARAQAEIRAGAYRGPLHGVPVAVKDLFDTAGIPTAVGMTIHAERRPADDATVVRRLAEAGAVLLGKLTMTEGALVHHHPEIAAPRNPWDAAHYAGASSSGSGVAVAAGLAFGSLGTDTGGSIRFPAAANGLTGIKPTWGRVSRHGCFALAESLDHVGPLARSAADAGALLGAIAGLDHRDPTTLAAPVPDYLAGLDGGLAGVRIGVDRAYNETDVDAAIVAALDEARAVLEGQGAIVEEVTLPALDEVLAAWQTTCAAQAAIAHEATYPARAAAYGTLREVLDAGRAASGIEVMKAHHARMRFAGALAAFFRDIDLLLIPTQPVADFTLAEEAELFAEPEGLAGFLRFVTPSDMAGSPTITLPCGFTDRGLPLSIQLVGRHLDEGLLVRAGRAYQRVTDWHNRHPAL